MFPFYHKPPSVHCAITQMHKWKAALVTDFLYQEHYQKKGSLIEYS